MKLPETHQQNGGLPLSTSDLLVVARVVPHPWKKGETRNVYEFPITRRIIIEADPSVPDADIQAMARRCHDKEIELEIMGGGYLMSLSPPNAIAQTPPTAVDLPRLVRQSYFGTVRITIGCMDRMCQVTYYNDKREKQDIRGTSQEVADHINSLPNTPAQENQT